jgi:hypothetical protein
VAYCALGWPTLTASQLEALGRLVGKLDVAPGPGGARIAPFGKYEADCWQILGLQPRTVVQTAVAALYQSRQISGHTDPPVPNERYHIPIQSNADCWVFHDGVWQQLELGRCYAMDPTKPHGAVNWGATVRLHLLIDTA